MHPVAAIMSSSNTPPPRRRRRRRPASAPMTLPRGWDSTHFVLVGDFPKGLAPNTEPGIRGDYRPRAEDPTDYREGHPWVKVEPETAESGATFRKKIQNRAVYQWVGPTDGVGIWLRKATYSYTYWKETRYWVEDGLEGDWEVTFPLGAGRSQRRAWW